MFYCLNSFNDVVGAGSFLVSLVALIISVVALRISREVVVYSSKDYEPQLEVTINDDSKAKVINRSKKLFKLVDVSLIEVRTVGFEDFENKIVVQMPLLVLSKRCPHIDGKSKVLINEDSPGPCAFQQCPINKDFVKRIDEKIHEEYMVPFLEGDNQKGYAYPSFQSVTYYVVVTYENKFHERKNAYFNKQHYHGSGYVDSKVSYEDLEAFLKYIDTPKFENFDLLWNHLIERYKIPSEQFWKQS